MIDEDNKEFIKEYLKYQRSLPATANRFIASKPFQATIPKGHKYKKLRAIAKLFDKSSKVNNYLIAIRLTLPIRDDKKGKRKLTKKGYDYNSMKYDKKINNRFRTLRKLFKPIGYTIRFNKDFSQVIALNKDAQNIQK